MMMTSRLKQSLPVRKMQVRRTQKGKTLTRMDYPTMSQLPAAALDVEDEATAVVRVNMRRKTIRCEMHTWMKRKRSTTKIK